MGRDSNPRYLAVHTLSRRAQSTALAPIQDELETFLRLGSSFNLFSTSALDAASSTGHSARNKRSGLIERLNERIKFGLELALALLDDLHLQLVAMQLDCRMVNMAFNFSELGLALVQRML
jgi:hypothetical protein